MSLFDQTLIDPTEAALLETLVVARETVANVVVRRSDSTARAVVAEVRERPEGVAYRHIEVHRREPPVTLAVAWWTDPLGRRHHRIVARVPDHAGPVPPLLTSDRHDFPPPFLVHPDRLVRRTRGDAAEWLATCGCGVTAP